MAPSYSFNVLFFRFFRISLNFEGLERATAAERGLLDSNSEPVRRVEVWEHVKNVQDASINALRLTEIRLTVLCEQIDISAFLPRLGTDTRRDVCARDGQRFITQRCKRCRRISRVDDGAFPIERANIHCADAPIVVHDGFHCLIRGIIHLFNFLCHDCILLLLVVVAVAVVVVVVVVVVVAVVVDRCRVPEKRLGGHFVNRFSYLDVIHQYIIQTGLHQRFHGLLSGANITINNNILLIAVTINIRDRATGARLFDIPHYISFFLIYQRFYVDVKNITQKIGARKRDTPTLTY
nr:MAG TPA: hypothetical protein [Bacteriophage sp.]